MKNNVSPCCGSDYEEATDSYCCGAEISESGICHECKEHSEPEGYICEECDEYFEETMEFKDWWELKKESIIEDKSDTKRKYDE